MKKGTLLIGSCIIVASFIALLIYLPSEKCDDRCEKFKAKCIEQPDIPCEQFLRENDITAQEFVDDPKYLQKMVQEMLRNAFKDALNNK